MANALMGLAGYRSQRQLYLDVVSEVLKGYDPNLLVSVLYVIGNLKDRSFMSELKALADSDRAQDEAVKRGLAWAFTCLDDTQGFDLFYDLFATPIEMGAKEPYIHFFAQLDRGFVSICSNSLQFDREIIRASCRISSGNSQIATSTFTKNCST